MKRKLLTTLLIAVLTLGLPVVLGFSSCNDKKPEENPATGSPDSDDSNPDSGDDSTELPEAPTIDTVTFLGLVRLDTSTAAESNTLTILVNEHIFILRNDTENLEAYEVDTTDDLDYYLISVENQWVSYQVTDSTKITVIDIDDLSVDAWSVSLSEFESHLSSNEDIFSIWADITISTTGEMIVSIDQVYYP